MYGLEYFNLIQRDILHRKLYFPRSSDPVPHAIIMPPIPYEPSVKINIPVKQINEDYNIKKFKKIMNKKRKKKNLEDKTQNIYPFLDTNNIALNPSYNPEIINIEKNAKIDMLNNLNNLEQNKSFCKKKEKKTKDIIKIINNDKSYFSKSLESEDIICRISNISLKENIRRVNSMQNLINKINSGIIKYK